MDSFTIMVGDFDTPFSAINKKTRQKQLANKYKICTAL